MTVTVMEAIQERFSVRSFKPYEIEDDKLARVMEAARLAPSASNRQEWRFVVVTDRTMRSALCQAASGQRFVAEAPVILAACAETDGHVMACGETAYPIVSDNIG